MMKPPYLLPSLLGGLALTLAAAPAFAQTETAPLTPPPAVVVSSPAGGGAGLGFGAVAWLQGPAGGQGVPAGIQVVYDQSMFHIEGVLGYEHISPPGMGASASTFDIGVAAWYHLFRGVNSDFSLGGGAGLIYNSAGPGSTTSFALEPGAEARVFLTPNFALDGRIGFAITFGDNNTNTTIGIGGQTSALFGFAYYIR
jgi:hypothetical protein